MNSQVRFQFQAGIEVVHGATRAAVHDFRSGMVYSVNSAGALILRHVETGQPLSLQEPEVLRFFTQLQDAGLVDPIAEAVVFIPPETRVPDNHHPLEFVWIELTDNCNLGCAHCYAETQNPALVMSESRPLGIGPPLSKDEWESVLWQVSKAGCRRVQFIGGEALPDRRLLSLIDIAQNVGISTIELFTNGTPLTQRLAQALSARGVRVAVSLHGTTPAVHDAITQVPGSFARAVSSIHLLGKQGIPVRIAAVAQYDNQNEIFDMGTLGDELGAYDVFVDVIRPIGSGQAIGLAPNSPEVLSISYLTEPQFTADRAIFDHNHHWNACWAGRLTITSTGEVIPCVMGRSEPIGNVRREPLEQILHSHRLRELWSITKDQVEVCRDCEYRYVCGDCRPLAIAAGSLHGSTSRCTYDPLRGDWGMVGRVGRKPSPAAESNEAALAPVSPLALRPETSNETVDDIPRASFLELRSKSNFFGCPPTGTSSRQPGASVNS